LIGFGLAVLVGVPLGIIAGSVASSKRRPRRVALFGRNLQLPP
jgi:ABC-type nitrate/sulfonate/bicarbonate transport system permease component